MTMEKKGRTIAGIGLLVGLVLVSLASLGGIVYGAIISTPTLIVASVVVLLLCVFGFTGFFMVAPNEARVLQLFGDYVGTVEQPGLRWANPFYTKHPISLRVRNFESDRLKVNDHAGNPIEIAAVVVWKVVDTAEAVFHVDDFVHFVHVQSEAALRNLATHYPYDAHDDESVSLRSHASEVSEQLKTEIQARLLQAGVEVIEARISHLAYAPEIASVMLQRQQASAIIAARQKIVEGAVGMVEMALQQLSNQKIVNLDEERKAAMVSNLLVVLCGDRSPQPIVEAGMS